MNGFDPAFWGGILTEVVANIIWVCITVAIAAAFVYRNDRAKFNGRWRAVIRWEHKWAETMLIGRPCSDPRSEGELALSYGSGGKRNQYWGLSFWQLRDGSTPLAQLCVELHGITLARRWTRRIPIYSHSLVCAKLNSRIRRGIGSFNYPAEFATYEVFFSVSSEDVIEGTVRAVGPRKRKPMDVGSFYAERVA